MRLRKMRQSGLRKELGRIQEGDIANLTLFTVKDEKVTLIDSEGISALLKEGLIRKGCNQWVIH